MSQIITDLHSPCDPDAIWDPSFEKSTVKVPLECPSNFLITEFVENSQRITKVSSDVDTKNLSQGEKQSSFTYPVCPFNNPKRLKLPTS